MLLPRFSLKLILMLNVVFALVFLVAKFAVDGQSWAIAIMVGVGTATALMLIFGGMFFAAYSFSIVYRSQRQVTTESPFATDRLPPQVIPPRHVDE